ncbi:MAG: urate hydroxylase PuuD [Deltaproteobacteria bacterium]|nr:MAG: urate hydroxylase PuuD [Deltaproteobacteria bacterium]
MPRKMRTDRRACGGRSLPSSDLSRRSDPGTVVCRRKPAFSEGGWMDSNLNEWLNLVFRWIHVLAGVMWIGHLWFFNFVNTQLAKTYDPDSRKKVVPEATAPEASAS